jgi:beta-galactosidase
VTADEHVDTRDRVRVVPGEGLRLGEQTLRLVGGAVHYWRHDPAEWVTILSAVRDLGFRVVDTYVPWSAHERTDGSFDFSGALDLARFAALAAELGLFLTVRPGPHINAEMPDFGFPTRVLWRPECQALGPLGTPILISSGSHFFPAPSYASSAFLAEVSRWYQAVGAVLAPLQWPRGPVVACQVDNECGYFFHLETFGFDYHPEFVARWQTYADTSLAPPTDASDDPALVRAWVRFREVAVRESLEVLAAGLRSAGVDRVPLFHNDYMVVVPPFDQASLEARGAVELAGNDCYVTRDEGRGAKRIARTLAGSSRLPFIPELGAGWTVDVVAHARRIVAPDQELGLLSVLLCGARAWSFYMLVDRDRWYGGATDRHGTPHESTAPLYRRLHRLLAETSWWDYHRRAPVILLRNRDLERRLAASEISCEAYAALDERLFPAALRRPPISDMPDLSSFYEEWRRELERRGLDFDEGSSDDPPDLARYAAVVVAPGAEPETELEHPQVLNGLPRDDVALPTPDFRHTAGRGVSLHHLVSADGRELLGVLNETAAPVACQLTFSGFVSLTGLWYGEGLDGTGCLDISIPAHGGQIWQVNRS